MAQLNSYAYDILPDRKDIRLLKILPPAPGGPSICLEIIVIRLGDPQSPKYCALSYTWDDAFHIRPDPTVPAKPDVLHDIQCNSRLLRVRENLYHALIRLRESGLSTYYWIDALSINQNDVPERSSQVQLMAEIYASAVQVIVWVGEADEHSNIALPIIEHLWDDVVDGPGLVAKFPTYLKFNELAFYQDINRPPLTISQWESIAQFFTRRWFRRLWVVQELVLAGDACILCGKDVWSWDNMLVFGLFLYKSAWWPTVRRIHAKNSPIVALGYETLVRIQKLSYCQSDGPNRPALQQMLGTWTNISEPSSKLCAFLGYILDQTRPMSTKDPRDKIYAILAMSTWYQRAATPTLPAPDYGKPVKEVFLEFTKHMLQNSNGLFILSWVDDIGRRRIKDLPSWVPDFSTEMLPLPLLGIKHFNATLSWEYIPPIINSPTAVLTLSGLFFDYIEEVSENIPDAIDQYKFLPLLDIVSRLHTMSSSGFDRLEVLMRTILADKIDESGTDLNKEHFPFHKVCKSYIDWLMHQMARSIIIGNQVPGDWILDSSLMKFREMSLLDPDQLCFDEFLATYTNLFIHGQPEQSEAFKERFVSPTLLFASMYDKSIWIRRLARSRSQNLLCLVAPSAQPGDQIWFLQGARVPFIVHLLPNGNFVLRGEAYVHGCMNGEIFPHYGLSTRDAAVMNIQ